MKDLFNELRRRNVHKVAFVYVLVGLLIVEMTWVFAPIIEAPEGLTQFIIALVVLGFLIALFVGWRFEMTPQGLKRTENLSPNEVIPYWSKRKFTAFTASVGLLDFAFLIYQTLRLRH